jgi:hypothetical protein
VDPELWPALEALGFERERIVRDVEAAVIDAILAGEPQGRSSAALLEFVFALDANSKIQLAAIASPDLDARMGGEHEVIQAVVRDFLNLALVPKRTPFAERIEEAFAKEELRPLARFVEAVELEIGEARRGGFRRIFPANGMQREGESDEALAKYAEFSEEEQTKFYGDMVPVFDQYIEDLLDCKNQGAACAVA